MDCRDPDEFAMHRLQWGRWQTSNAEVRFYFTLFA